MDDEHVERLSDKLTDLNTEVRRGLRKLELKRGMDELVRRGELGHDPETGEYWTLPALYEDHEDEG
jgi:hypothetical protein